MKNTTKDFSDEDFQNLIIEQFKKCQNIEMVILKGHILIEYSLNHYFEHFSKDESSFENGKFTFSQKIHLFKCLSGCQKEIIDIINLLNTIRNDIAHRLEYNNQHISSLINNSRKSFNTDLLRKENSQFINLQISISYLFGYIIGYKNALLNDRKIIKELTESKNKQQLT